MKKIFLTLLISCILSCSGEKSDEIPLFNGIYFRLKQDERLATVDRSVKDKYDLVFNNNLVQIPLFRFIRHKNYEIFIGIPVNANIRSIADDRLKKQDSLITQVSLDTASSYFFRSYKRNSAYIEEYATTTAQNTVIFISATFNLKDTATKVFPDFELFKRINIKN